jgi:hypothetical protein
MRSLRFWGTCRYFFMLTTWNCYFWCVVSELAWKFRTIWIDWLSGTRPMRWNWTLIRLKSPLASKQIQISWSLISFQCENLLHKTSIFKFKSVSNSTWINYKCIGITKALYQQSASIIIRPCYWSSAIYQRATLEEKHKFSPSKERLLTFAKSVKK